MNRTPGTPHRPALIAASAVALSCLGATAPQERPKIESTRVALEKWIETERVIAKERADWRLGREMLESRTAIVEHEIATLRERIVEAERDLAEADSKRDELLAARAALTVTGDVLDGAVRTLEARVRELMPRLPAPIAELVRPLGRALPPPDGGADLGLGRRFQNTIGILDQVEKFHREMSLSPEVRDLDDGRSVEVTVLYAGLSQGWFVTPDGLSAGVGVPAADGWTWSFDAGAAADVRAAIEVASSERRAAYVALPVHVR